MDPDTNAWEARAERDVGVLIHSYLLTHPVPGESELADSLARSADDFLGAGRLHLARLHVRPLRAVGGGA